MSGGFASIEEIVAADATKYDTVEAYGKTIRIGSLSSADMIDWIEAQLDKEKGRFAGIHLLVMSIVGPNGERVMKEERDAMVEVFKGKDANSNRAIIKKARALNGLDGLGVSVTLASDTLKNDSGEASTDASPIDSASK